MPDFGRKVRLVITGMNEEISIENLRVDFSVSKNSESNSNKSTISIYNLNETTRSFVADSKDLEFYVGYETSETEYLYVKGENDDVNIYPDGLDVVTTIEVEEGKNTLENSNFIKSYTTGTTRKKIVKDALASLSLDSVIDEKLVDRVLDTLDDVDSKLENGSTFCKKTKDFLDDFFKLAGISYSIQNGELLILSPDDTLGSDTYYISPSNGLIGNPIKTKKGCDIQTMLLPELKIGMKINLDSKYIKGNFKVIEFIGAGSTHGNEWGMNIKLKELKK